MNQPPVTPMQRSTPSSVRFASRPWLALAVGACAGLLAGGCSLTSPGQPSGNGAVVKPGVTSSDAAANSAESAIMRGDRDEALRLFTRAIEINPEFTRAHMGMADVYRIDGDYAKAEKAYGKSAALEPQSFDAQYFHGLMLHVVGRVQDAIGAYLRSLSIKPDDFQANLNISAAYYQIGESGQGLPYAQTAVRLNPKDGTARLNLGTLYAELGKDREAVAEYQQAAELMPLTSALLTNLSDSLGRLQRFDEMRNTLEQLVKTEPSPAAHERLGYALFKLKVFDESRESFNRALGMDPNYCPALNGLGVCELNAWLWSERKDEGARSRAFDALRKSLVNKPAQTRIQEILSRYQ